MRKNERRFIAACVGGGWSCAAAVAAAGSWRCLGAEQTRRIFVLPSVGSVASLRHSHTGFAPKQLKY